MNGDGFVDKNEFNQAVKDKADSLHERQIDFFKKVLTRDDCDRISYQGKKIYIQKTKLSYDLFIFRISS